MNPLVLALFTVLASPFVLAADPITSFDEPIQFEPLFMERIWGGRELERFHKQLPPDSLIGESWEIVDRPEAQSVVKAGPFEGKSLHELWRRHRELVFGDVSDSPRFPILIKLLDANQRLSVQVHPTAEMAQVLSGEPKTEMWVFMDTYGDGDIFAGLKKGVTKEQFSRALIQGTVADLIHRIVAKPGDAFFIPSGRIHAIGAGNVIVEVQQNSDTTYRVFDWNRLGLDGKPRPLHIEESLQCIDFNDYEPSMIVRKDDVVADCDYFHVEEWKLEEAREAVPEGRFAIFACLSGEVRCGSTVFQAGDFFLVPAAMKHRVLVSTTGETAVLRITLPQ